MSKKIEPSNGYVKDLLKELEEMSQDQREDFLIQSLDSTFGILRPSCMKVKKLKKDIAGIREKILDD